MVVERMSNGALPAIAALLMAVGGVLAQPDSPDKPRLDRGGPGLRRGDDAGPPGNDRGPLGAPRRPRPGPMGGRPPLWSDLPEAERRQIENFIEENFPRMFVELHRLKEQNQRRFTFRMSRIAPQMRRIMETMKVDPQRGALMIRERQVEMEILQTVLRYRQATEEIAKRRLRTRLEELAGQIFDLRHDRRADEVRELETRLDLLKNRLSESQSMRSELIQRHVEQILNRPAPPFSEEEEADEPPRESMDRP